MAQKKALITGITGQDGSYLAELLLKKGYQVFGMFRRSSNDPFDRIRNILGKIQVMGGDLTDQASMLEIIKKVHPDEVYNLAAQSFVPTSWEQPILTGEVTALGVTRILEAIRHVDPKIKFYNAASSEMFGKVTQTPQNESTPFYPRSPYGVSKVYGFYITKNYRESYGMFAVNGILFNHESPRRGLQFVTRKISHGVACIKLGLQKELLLGNLDAKRDWGYAPEYTEAMHLMMQHKHPEDFVIATGEMHSVREFCEAAFTHAGLDYRDYVKTDPLFLRPAEVDLLVGDISKAKKLLGWQPKVKCRELAELMVDADLALMKGAHKPQSLS
ncbi:GDP-mannose 4,6-dehydratase [Candidatus Woesearchaeota archaeon]|nr:GDP-mannose 4,6-dehydratase [Candidatus Woesearchaeota archaeon]